MKIERLKELLHYNPITGAFTWNKPNKKSNKVQGEAAGGISSTGYYSITLDDRHYQGAKLAYMYMTGIMPKTVLTINRNKSDLRWDNITIPEEVPDGETTQEILKEFFNYNPDTGVFTRIKSTSKVALKGSIAGGMTKNGYLIISVGKNRHYAHRLAFLYVEGKFPEVIVDHINGDKSDNRWLNLRQATYSENNCNNKRGTSNTGYKGVTLGTDGYYHANCTLNGKMYQKVFKTLEEAVQFATEHREKLHGDFVNHGL